MFTKGMSLTAVWPLLKNQMRGSQLPSKRSERLGHKDMNNGRLGFLVTLVSVLICEMRFIYVSNRLMQNEIKYMGKLNHPNIVKLIGYCKEGEQRILVYEYMSKGSLETQLLAEKAPHLDWRRRINVAIDIAKALDSLHNHGTPVIHRDLKASNVLLDKVRLFCHSN